MAGMPQTGVEQAGDQAGQHARQQRAQQRHPHVARRCMHQHDAHRAAGGEGAVHGQVGHVQNADR